MSNYVITMISRKFRYDFAQLALASYSASGDNVHYSFERARARAPDQTPALYVCGHRYYSRWCGVLLYTCDVLFECISNCMCLSMVQQIRGNSSSTGGVLLYTSLLEKPIDKDVMSIEQAHFN